MSTSIDYLLCNLGVRYLILAGVLTDQYGETVVRDVCDLGFLVTLVPDACATYSQARCEGLLRTIQGYCCPHGTSALLDEIKSVKGANQRCGQRLRRCSFERTHPGW